MKRLEQSCTVAITGSLFRLCCYHQLGHFGKFSLLRAIEYGIIVNDAVLYIITVKLLGLMGGFVSVVFSQYTSNFFLILLVSA